VPSFALHSPEAPISDWLGEPRFDRTIRWGAFLKWTVF
jgi:hypothetical protein